MILDKQSFRDAMAKLCAAVNVVTTDGQAGLGGFTASAVCSVTDDPPTLLVCMNREGKQAATFKSNGVICVNVLSDGHEEMSALFAGRDGLSVHERFERVVYRSDVTGSPVLANSVVSFDCRISQIVEVGTHNVMFCRVLSICGGTGVKALVYFNRAYHQI